MDIYDKIKKRMEEGERLDEGNYVFNKNDTIKDLENRNYIDIKFIEEANEDVLRSVDDMGSDPKPTRFLSHQLQYLMLIYLKQDILIRQNEIIVRLLKGEDKLEKFT